jgi:selenocysteine lyase/cysteine desulfurase
VLAAAPQLLETLRPDKLLPSTDAVPERFELGTLPYELLAGTTAAVDFIAGLGEAGRDSVEPRRPRIVASMSAVEAHEDALRERLERGLADLRPVTVYSRAAHRTPTVLMTFADRSVADAYRFLATQNINAPAGTFYAYEPARRLGLDGGGLRAGLSAYNDDNDVDRLLEALTSFLS